tara:strand:- start:2244 stop:2588 length:345 start_codon:yes stop_codon:yes gene_type:complete
MMHGKRKKKKGSMQKFLEKNQVFKSMEKPAPAPAPAAPTAPRPIPTPRTVGPTGGLLRSLLRIQNAMGGGSAANARGVGASLGRKIESTVRPVPGLRREMEKVNRRVRQRFGAK